MQKQNEISLMGIHVYSTQISLGKRVIQTNPSKLDERLFSDIYLCRLRLNKEEKYIIFKLIGKEFQRDAPAKVMLVLNKSSFVLRM